MKQMYPLRKRGIHDQESHSLLPILQIWIGAGTHDAR